jgi:hypothetical protein
VLAVLSSPVFAAKGPASGIRKAANHPAKTILLDRVVAVVAGQAILASDVDAEMRFAALEAAPKPASGNTPHQALDRIVDQRLIDRQSTLRPGLASITQKQVDRSIQNLRSSIPACVKFHCSTDAGWREFLAGYGFTEAEVRDRMRERLALLKFINVRFTMAARVSDSDVRQYYERTLLPELASHHISAPKLDAVAEKIREILRQRQISTMVDQWLKSLRGENPVRIVDAAYGAEKGGG